MLGVWDHSIWQNACETPKANFCHTWRLSGSWFVRALCFVFTARPYITLHSHPTGLPSTHALTSPKPSYPIHLSVIAKPDGLQAALAHPQFLALGHAHREFLSLGLRVSDYLLANRAHSSWEFLHYAAVYSCYVFVLMIVAHLSIHWFSAVGDRR